MFKLRFIFSIISLLIINTALAQEFKLSGTLINPDDKSTLPGATVKIVNLRDTTKFKYTNSDMQGEFSFEKLTRGRFRLEITYIGFENYFQEVVVNEKSGQYRNH